MSEEIFVKTGYGDTEISLSLDEIQKMYDDLQEYQTIFAEQRQIIQDQNTKIVHDHQFSKSMFEEIESVCEELIKEYETLSNANAEENVILYKMYKDRGYTIKNMEEAIQNLKDSP